jgi:ribosomal protein L30/L7E
MARNDGLRRVAHVDTIKNKKAIQPMIAEWLL